MDEKENIEEELIKIKHAQSLPYAYPGKEVIRARTVAKSSDFPSTSEATQYRNAGLGDFYGLQDHIVGGKRIPAKPLKHKDLPFYYEKPPVINPIYSEDILKTLKKLPKSYPSSPNVPFPVYLNNDGNNNFNSDNEDGSSTGKVVGGIGSALLLSTFIYWLYNKIKGKKETVQKTKNVPRHRRGVR